MKTELIKIGFCVIVLVTVSCAVSKAANQFGKLASNATGELNLERIFSSDEFEPAKFGPARWLEDGSGYTTLEDSDTQEEGKDIVRYEPETGSREVMVPATRLIPPGESAPLEIDGYCWSPDGANQKGGFPMSKIRPSLDGDNRKLVPAKAGIRGLF